MPRNMSFSMTTEQFKNGSKDVTRRMAWWFLKPGDVVQAVEKAMGLKKGEQMVKLGLIEIISTRKERLYEITPEDCIREGFPDFTPEQFVSMLCKHYNIPDFSIVNRIEFKRL